MKRRRVTDDETGTARAEINIRNAQATCSVCAKCGRKLSAKAPVWRERVVVVEFSRDWAVVPVCERCAGVARMFAGPPQPCEGCGRPVHQYMEHQRAHVVCCEACARIARLAAARQRRSDARGTRECKTCGEVFEPMRSDALLFIAMPPAGLSRTQGSYG